MRYPFTPVPGCKKAFNLHVEIYSSRIDKVVDGIYHPDRIETHCICRSIRSCDNQTPARLHSEETGQVPGVFRAVKGWGQRMRAKSGFLVMLALILSARVAAQPTPNPAIWNTGSIAGDTLFFVRENEGERPAASLLLVPTDVPELSSATREIHYELGADFIWHQGSRRIELPAGSRIPFKRRSELYPDASSPNAAQQALDREDKGLLFGEGHFFHDLQVVASYRAQESWFGVTPQSKRSLLPNTEERIGHGQRLNLVIIGDSISAGCNASGSRFVRAKPNLPPYPERVAEGLKVFGASSVVLTNLSVGGTSSAWGVTKIAGVVHAAPDLLVIAFGMNDAFYGVSASPTEYAAHIRTIVEETRKSLPNCEFILIAPMIGNPEWRMLNQERFPEFRNELLKLEGKGVAVADVTSVWAALMQRKSFYDLTGNGLNHPNDFGHYIYASVVLATLQP